MTAWVDEVLGFWFGELGPADWFSANPALDARIRERFGALHAQLANGPLPAPDDARAFLAAVVALDQFPRQMFRGSPQAFASDARARSVAGDAVARGLDRQLTPEQRLFLYLPFQHSEDLADQVRAVALTEALGNPGWTDYARRHQALIARFGRFPHRNAVLGRPSTAEELEALKQPGNAF